ncbi:hypothetical protein [Paenibacillus sp. GP183]|uniref:hypothetical protein n=1 Tax=Paenibacillus sp. GP183 TaxID=1882751 RepID=UPI00344B5045
MLDSYSYKYDANSKRTSIVTNNGTISYQYDALNQLTQETLIDGKIIAYTYDKVGNRTSKSQFHKVVQAYRTRESTLVTASTTSDCHKEFFDKDPRFSLQYRVLASSFSGNLILKIGSACSSSSRLTSCLS